MNMFYNEFSDVSTILLLFYLFVLLISATLWHELGHMFYFKTKLKRNIRLYFNFNSLFRFKFLAGKQHDYNILSTREYLGVISYGVLFGAVPIIIVSFLNTYFPFYLMLLPYLIGCRNDLKQMYKIIETD